MTLFGTSYKERRLAERYRVLSSGRAVTPRFPRGVPIVIRNVSDDGCLLVGNRIDYLAKKGEKITLLAVEEGVKVAFRAEVRWRANKQMGLSFLDADTLGQL